MRIAGTLLLGSALATASLWAGAATAASGFRDSVQMSCSVYSKVRSANETYVIGLNGARSKARVSRDSEAPREVSVVANERAVILFYEADGGRYNIYLNRESAALSASFVKGGKLLKEQVYGSCALPAGQAL